MSNVIPPLLSDSPPPTGGPLDDEEDDFGDFTSAGDLSYGYDNYSLPSSPRHSREFDLSKTELDGNVPEIKDFQDKRKNCDVEKLSETEVNFNKKIESPVNIETKVENSTPTIEKNDAKIGSEKEISDDETTTESFSEIQAENKIQSINGFIYEEEPPDFNGDSEKTVEFDEYYENYEMKNYSNRDVNENTLSDKIEDKIEEKIPIDDLVSSETKLEITNSLSESPEDKQDVKADNPTPDETIDDQVEPNFGEVKTALNDNSTDKELNLNKADNESASEGSNDRVIETDVNPDFDEFGDFADFSKSFPEASDFPEPSDLPKSSDFPESSDFSKPSDFPELSDFPKPSEAVEQLEELDFGEDEDDFCEFEQAEFSGAIPPSKNIFEYAEKILSEVFPRFEADADDEYVPFEFLKGDRLFESMRDITETNALSYQWAKSSSQEKLLGALKIDTRNILYGPSWNPMMPKFAANLRTTPLEPVKSELPTPTPGSSSSPGQFDSTPTDVPSVQFDWKGAGLENPLESTQNSTLLLDLEQLVASLDLSHSMSESLDHSVNGDLDEWDYWLKAVPIEPKDKSKADSEKPSDFLSHRRNHSDNESVKSLQLTTDIERSEGCSNPVGEEFDDFGQWQKNVPLKETHIAEPIEEKKSDTPIDEKKIEDEFTDFQMGVPQQPLDNLNDILQPTPISEPIKPSVVTKVEVTSPEILWPDPGIISDELLRIELSYCRKTSCDEDGIVKSKEIEKNEIKVVNGNFEAVKEKENIPSNELDEEWSEFVSNPAPVKANPLELQLSIPHLSQLQPPKQPIPVITPHGLIQTKIPSNASKASQNFVPRNTNFSKNFYQPSIISQQYQNHLNGPIFPKLSKESSSSPMANFSVNQTNLNLRPYESFGKKQCNDDDDWTEFVSSVPIQQNKQKLNVVPNIPNRNFLQTNGTSGFRRNVVPSISSIPELDFAAPKSKTYKKK